MISIATLLGDSLAPEFTGKPWIVKVRGQEEKVGGGGRGVNVFLES